ncbi:uncharacterized protein LOC130496551 isoform X2 [Raphanus sativus]|uniref:Uncharacterized protein LOC130496551 isoform X2 n=1 Tax=Raphanus sativus TaxID=3726 RepID=A0A9W3BZ65_RAPSA|nr:uncharacterized protein LOC130496551 isoform X2 [Raphanus sativus]
MCWSYHSTKMPRETIQRRKLWYMPFFEDCIGALEGTHLPVRPPSDNPEPYKGRKGELTINVLVICNLKMRFIYAYVGVSGKAHDTKVLTHFATHESFFLHPPDVEELEHTLYLPSGDRAMEIRRDAITEKIARESRLPY